LPENTPAFSAESFTRPLCVDLDGTLVKSDTLIDSLLVLMRTRPLRALRLPGRLLHGKAAFKAFVTGEVNLDVHALPYNRPVLHYLQEERRRGRQIYLATGADLRLAERVAAHLGLFAGVLGSDGSTNLTGSRKLAGLRARLGSGPFDYIGNDTPDMPMLAVAAEPMVANPSPSLCRSMKRRHIEPARSFIEGRSLLASLVKAIRVQQWAKNLIIFIPLLLSHALSTGKLLTAFAAFCCFSMAASSAYITNDLLDIEADRRHPRKRSRPFASGDLRPFTGVCIAAVFLVAALVGSGFIGAAFHGWLVLYLVTTVAYTWLLKRFALIDVLALSGLYILRLLAGAAATGVTISHWLAGFSMFLFLSLAIVKRFAELENLRASQSAPRNGRGYQLIDLEQLRAFGTASAYAAIVVLCIYIAGQDVTKLYRTPGLLWIMAPLMLLWLNRMWLLASRGKLEDDPVAFALKDRQSLLIGLGVVIVVLLAL
jgi:4-hydroxybenzoate polyprenyltransferase